MTSKQILALAKLFQLKPHTASMWDRYSQFAPPASWSEKAQYIQGTRSGWTIDDVIAMYEINEVFS
jgi:hypothetical protein